MEHLYVIEDTTRDTVKNSVATSKEAFVGEIISTVHEGVIEIDNINKPCLTEKHNVSLY